MTTGKASSYGDAGDMLAYEREFLKQRALGKTIMQASLAGRKVGDPGIGWLDNVLSDSSVPWVALPPDDWKAKFGTKGKAHRAKVRVTINGKTVICILGDTMPAKKNIKNGAVIDLAPGAQAAFGLKPPFMVACSWEWA